MSPTAVQSPPELLRGTGADGVEYIVRMFSWDLDKAQEYYDRFNKLGLISDDVPNNLDGFVATMLGSMSIWFEFANAITDENVGFIYLNGMEPSKTSKRCVSATFHAIVWDSKASPRIPLAKAFLKEIFRMFKLHRLQCAIPMNRGGAIRAVKKLGFKSEGVMRDAVSYKGVWFSVLLLSLLEGEV